jgi:GTP-binding protein LepA
LRWFPCSTKWIWLQADPENAKTEIEDVIGIDASDAIPCSAKTGMGVDEILEAIVAKIPPPQGNPNAPLRAMIVDSWFDTYVGVVMLVRVVDGRLAKGERFKMMATNAVYNADNLGRLHPRQPVTRVLRSGRGGLHHCRYQGIASRQGGRHHHPREKTAQRGLGPPEQALPGFKEIQPQVFAGLYPTEANQYDALRDSFGKTQAQRFITAL